MRNSRILFEEIFLEDIWFSVNFPICDFWLETPFAIDFTNIENIERIKILIQAERLKTVRIPSLLSLLKTFDSGETSFPKRDKKYLIQQEERHNGEGPVNVTDQDFDQLVTRNHLFIVDFWAPWCVPCKKIIPIMRELSQELSPRARFAEMNIDDNPRIPVRFHIRSIPTIMIFKEGRPVDQIIGFFPKNTIKKKVLDSF